MQNVSLQTAVKMTGKSESTIRRDVKKGKVSAGRDARGHLQFDVAELQRAYGEMKTTGEDAQSTEQGNGKAMTGHDTPKIVALLENQIQDLKAQLEKADAQLEIATTEKTKLLDLLSAEKEEKRALMPPVDEKNHRKSPNWLLRLVGAR